MQIYAYAVYLLIGVVMQTRCLHAGFDPGPGPRTARDLCPHGYYNSLAECPEKLECTDNSNCSSEDVCCPNSCGTSTCVAPWIQEEITEDQSLCQNVSCEGQGRHCLVFNGRTWCMCRQDCEPITHNRQLICDQHGSTHRSMCFLDRRACVSGRVLIPTRCVSISDSTPVDTEVISGPSFNIIFGEETASEGNAVTLMCQPTGNPRPTIYWQPPVGNIFAVETRLDLHDNRISVDTTGSLTIRNLRVSDSGRYQCVANSKVGGAIKTVQLNVEGGQGERTSTQSARVDCSTLPIVQSDKCGTNQLASQTGRITEMWVYIPSKNACERTHIRDCPAITNKFQTEGDCKRACVKNICHLTPDRGPCRQFVQRIVYDAKVGVCRSFAYGGCGGNLNNFLDMDECRKMCAFGPYHGGILTYRCPRCGINYLDATCKTDFIIVGNIKHFRSVRQQRNRNQYLHVEITEVLSDTSNSLRLNRRNLRSRSEARMQIRLDVNATCPCPLNNLEDGANQNANRRGRWQRYDVIPAIIAGNVVDGFPTVTSGGLTERRTDFLYLRMKKLAKNRGFCSKARSFLTGQ